MVPSSQPIRMLGRRMVKRRSSRLSAQARTIFSPMNFDSSYGLCQRWFSERLSSDR